MPVQIGTEHHEALTIRAHDREKAFAVCRAEAQQEGSAAQGQTWNLVDAGDGLRGLQTAAIGRSFDPGAELVWREIRVWSERLAARRRQASGASECVYGLAQAR